MLINPFSCKIGDLITNTKELYLCYDLYNLDHSDELHRVLCRDGERAKRNGIYFKQKSAWIVLGRSQKYKNHASILLSPAGELFLEFNEFIEWQLEQPIQGIRLLR